MAITVRKAVASDAPAWIELLKAVLGEEYPDKQVYDPSWLQVQLESEGGAETWVAEDGSKLLSSISFLPPSLENANPVANLGRHLNRPESYTTGAAAALLARVCQLTEDRKQVAVGRLFVGDHALQVACENAGFVCAGFQPFKHMNRVREGTLFYYRIGQHDLRQRLPISDSFPQMAELATVVLRNFNIPPPAILRDGVTGYPLQSELTFSDGNFSEFSSRKGESQWANPPVEISGAYNQGAGYLRSSGSNEAMAIFGTREEKTIAGILYIVDPVDRCVRVIDSFTTDDLAMGPLLNHIAKVAQTQHNSIYVEMDVLVTAPRLLKSAEQLGFVPVAYFPAVYIKGGTYTDVIKLVKLNIVYSLENLELTNSAKAVVHVVDQHFQDQKMGVAIINLLRGLPFFNGLGDGELRKIARLFTQKLFRPGEKIFNKGDTGNEAYVVMRGQIDILLEEGGTPLAQLGNGQIFGELAFLSSAPRAASAVASQPSILLVIQRSAFNNLVEHEPHLGMVVMRNIALELTNRLRKTNEALANARK